MKITRYTILYSLICNAIVSLALCLTASLVASPIIDPGIFFINYAVGYSIASIVGIFVPLVEIGKRFTEAFNVKADTFTNNRPYRFLAVGAITLVYFAIVSPSLSILNYFLIEEMSIKDCINGWFKNMLPLLTVGYLVSIIADKFTYTMVHKLNPEF